MSAPTMSPLATVKILYLQGLTIEEIVAESGLSEEYVEFVLSDSYAAEPSREHYQYSPGCRRVQPLFVGDKDHEQ